MVEIDETAAKAAAEDKAIKVIDDYATLEIIMNNVGRNKTVLCTGCALTDKKPEKILIM